MLLGFAAVPAVGVKEVSTTDLLKNGQSGGRHRRRQWTLGRYLQVLTGGGGGFSQEVRRTPIRPLLSRRSLQAEHAQMHAQIIDAAVEGGRGQFADLTGLSQILRLLEQIEERALITVHAG